jgi:hypothetical protein
MRRDKITFLLYLTYGIQEVKKLKLNSVACSPQANYTNRAAAAC